MKGRRKLGGRDGEVRWCGCACETKQKAEPQDDKRDYRGCGPIILRIPRPSMQSHRGHLPRPHFRAGRGGNRRRVMTKPRWGNVENMYTRHPQLVRLPSPADLFLDEHQFSGNNMKQCPGCRRPRKKNYQFPSVNSLSRSPASNRYVEQQGHFAW